MDMTAAEEARRTLEYLGVSSSLVPDVGVAGLLRLLSRLEEIERADVVIAVAGMEASLFSVIGGLVGRPLIAVPTARGYGAAFGGLASLLSAVNSCANGVTAVNIDSGYGAAMAAYRILSGGPRRWDRKKERQPAPPSTRTKPRSASTASARKRSSASRRRRSG
jgi:NCAIR mutase (PurE)-related protein